MSQHGNGKEGTEYIRTPASVMTEMSDMLKRENPLKVYNKLVLKHDELSGPSSRKQVHDKKYNDKKKERKMQGLLWLQKSWSQKNRQSQFFVANSPILKSNYGFTFYRVDFLVIFASIHRNKLGNNHLT